MSLKEGFSFQGQEISEDDGLPSSTGKKAPCLYRGRDANKATSTWYTACLRSFD